VFAKIINFVLQEEGGYVNHPSDPGGETNYGISKRSHPEVDIKNLTKVGAIDIYRKEYWNPAWEELGFPLAACMMDTAVNMGPGRAKQFLDKCGGSYVQYLQLRIARYKDIISARPASKVFEKGWMNRMARLRRFIDEEIQSTPTPSDNTGGSESV
jgi:lysozyme family protein